MEEQRKLASQWRTFDDTAQIQLAETIPAAVQHAENTASKSPGLLVLATGDFHMVGGILSMAQQQIYHSNA